LKAAGTLKHVPQPVAEELAPNFFYQDIIRNDHAHWKLAQVSGESIIVPVVRTQMVCEP
jgi:hypothetical protein